VAAPGQRALWFETDDEKALVGRLFGDDGRRPLGVLLLHSTQTDMRSWFPLAQRLMDRGYVVLTFDFRGFGQSDGPPDEARMPIDVAAGLEVLALSGIDRVGIVGSGAGGTAALAATFPDTVTGFAAIGSSARSEELDVREEAAEVETRALILDPPGGDGGSLADLLPDARLQRIEATDRAESDERVMTLLSGFIEDSVGEPG
jgi:pimeloyl-ACP methyl ester carboxylesterase